jgi:hypothetical protein
MGILHSFYLCLLLIAKAGRGLHYLARTKTAVITGDCAGYVNLKLMLFTESGNLSAKPVVLKYAARQAYGAFTPFFTHLASYSYQGGSHGCMEQFSASFLRNSVITEFSNKRGPVGKPDARIPVQWQ